MKTRYWHGNLKRTALKTLGEEANCFLRRMKLMKGSDKTRVCSKIRSVENVGNFQQQFGNGTLWLQNSLGKLRIWANGTCHLFATYSSPADQHLCLERYIQDSCYLNTWWFIEVSKMHRGWGKKAKMDNYTLIIHFSFSALCQFSFLIMKLQSYKMRKNRIYWREGIGRCSLF